MGSGEVAIVALSTMISLKVTFSDGLGGGKYNVTHQSTPSPLDSHTSFIPSIPHNASISAITFRNKNQGWKTYRMEISLTSGAGDR